MRTSVRYTILTMLVSTVILFPAYAADNQSLVNEGYAQLAQGKYHTAIARFSTRLHEQPLDIEARRYLAFSLLKVGLFEQATLQSQALVAQSKCTAADHILLGDALYGSGRKQQSLAAYQQALTLDKKSVRASIGLARVYLSLKQPQLASQICCQALSLTTTVEERNSLHSLQNKAQTAIKHLGQSSTTPAGEFNS